MKRKLTQTLILFILVLSSASIASAQLNAPVVLDETVVTVSDLLVTINGTGEIEPLRTVPLTFGMPGTVYEIRVAEGQYVEAGEVLARLDARELELALHSAEIALLQQQIRFEQLIAPARDVDLAAAEAALDVAEASLNAARSTGRSQNDVEIARLQTEMARNQLWQSQLQRDQALELNPEFRFSATNDPETQAAQLNSGLAQADIGIAIANAQYAGTVSRGADQGRIAQANAAIIQASIQLDNLVNGPDAHDLRLAEIALQNSEIAVEQVRLQLEETLIIAPFAGMVTANNLVIGQLPPANQPAFEVVDASAFVVDLLIDETDVVYLETDLPVNLDLDALSEAAITGTIHQIALMPVPGSPVPVYRAQVQLDPTLEPIRVGMSVTASVVLEELPDVLVVPKRFITLDRATQQATVTVLDANNRANEIPVTLGQQNDTQTQILAGLEAGQRIVLLDTIEIPGA